MFLNVDQLEKQLDKKEFQENGSKAAFKVLETQFQKFIKSRFSLNDDDGLMTRKYFLAYMQTEVQQFHDSLIQHMESVKKSIDERALHEREFDSRVNERLMQTKEGKVYMSGNDIDTNDAYIKPVYDEELMAEVKLTVKCNVFANDQQHAEQPEFNYEGKVDQNDEQWHDKGPLLAKLTDNKTPELSYQSLESKNICLKKTVAQLQKDFSKLKAHFINLELQLQNNVLKSGQQS
ncbi:hypothetical protein Tco_0243037 [Tanacetum coccineum]